VAAGGLADVEAELVGRGDTGSEPHASAAEVSLSSMSPHPSPKSSSSGAVSEAAGEIVELRRLDEARGMVEVEATVCGVGLDGTPFGTAGVEDDLSSGVGLEPLLFGWISPLAVPSLLVKEEMAQPIHWFAGCGVPMRVGPADWVSDGGGGWMVSGSVVAYLRIRSR